MLRRWIAYSSAAIAGLCLSACGNDSDGYRFKVFPAVGKVVYKGKPLPRAFVRFHPTDPAKVQLPDGQTGLPVLLTTETDEKGKFSHSTYVADDGVPAGDYAVTVMTTLPSRDVENSDGPAQPPPRAAMPSKTYRDPAKTPLKATVKEGVNEFTFELE
ncbi:hypothetical protein [Singulisphaera sp. PoT]|uniref:hypothetical protein n=1 Tax=Singulisphaera sp. PoT TaxID=3411797 RepID=UPI003BF5100B